MKLGLQGTTVVSANGDDGVAIGSEPCLGKNIFVPGSAVGCPYVTSVGGTFLPVVRQPEQAASHFSSGGDFSNILSTTDYQRAVVDTYFVKNDPGYPSCNTTDGVIPETGAVYNRAGRGYPDVSALAEHGMNVRQGRGKLEGGPSMATPIIASVVTRINEERLNANKTTIGFVNPVLYQHPEAFNDVLIGDQSKGGRTELRHQARVSIQVSMRRLAGIL